MCTMVMFSIILVNPMMCCDDVDAVDVSLVLLALDG